MKAIWVVSGFIVPIIIVNLVVFTFAPAINTALNAPGADRLIMLITVVVEGIGAIAVPFLHSHYEAKLKRSNDERDELDKHRYSIVEMFEKARTDGYLPKLDAVHALLKFKYGKEFLQHLFTGHHEIFGLVKTCIDDERAFNIVNKKLEDHVKSKVRQITDELGFCSEARGRRSWCFVNVIARHVIDRAETLQNEFVAKTNQIGVFIVTRETGRGEETCAVNELDNAPVQRLTTALNELAASETIVTMVSDKATALNAKKISSEQGNRRLQEFVNAVILHGIKLVGCCDDCAEKQGHTDCNSTRLGEFESIKYDEE